MSKDPDNHRQTSMPVEGAAIIFNAPPQFEQWSMSKTRLSSLAQLVRADAPCA